MRVFSSRGHALPLRSKSFCTRHQKSAATAASPPGGTAPDNGTHYASLLGRCSATRSLSGTRSIHQQMMKAGFLLPAFIGTKLIDAYLKCGAAEDARQVLDETSGLHVVSWNGVLSSYAHQKRTGETVALFRRMILEGVVPDCYTYSSVLHAFTEGGLLPEGREVHGRIVVSGLGYENPFTCSALVDMYAKLGRLPDARLVFDRTMERDVVLFTSMVSGYTQNGEHEEAIRVFRTMLEEGVKPNEFTFSSVLIPLGNRSDLAAGRQVHGAMVRSGLETGDAPLTSLLCMYSRCLVMEESLKVFEMIRNPNTVTWTALVGVLVCNHMEELALSAFRDMARASASPNAYTLSTALRACSCLALLMTGKQIQAGALKIGLDRNTYVSSALVDLYGKCGDVKAAAVVFNRMAELDIVTLNSMIYAYSQNGCVQDAVRLFNRIPDYGLAPNEATFTCVLSACSNSGQLEEARRIFSSIGNHCNNGPSKDHYSCMVDLLGRTGRLQEAESLIHNQAKEAIPDVAIWRALLSACAVHGDAEMAERVAESILKLDPGDEGTHILLSNIYAASGEWQKVTRIKACMKEMKQKKGPAVSWVDSGLAEQLKLGCSHNSDQLPPDDWIRGAIPNQ